MNMKSTTKAAGQHFVVCLSNEGLEASLERRKIYLAVLDADAEARGLVRIIDESGDDYLYPRANFRQIELPQALGKAILAA
jgi:hypothetical protein